MIFVDKDCDKDYDKDGTGPETQIDCCGQP